MAKHDFLILSEDELPTNDTASNAVFEALDAPIDPKALQKNSTIYSYPDGPQVPGPISRSLTVIGFIETSSPMVQQLETDTTKGILEKCTIGVKKIRPELPDKDKINSTNFAKFINKLRRQDMVAVLSKDKYGRFGILRPLQDDDDDEKFAAECFVGDIERAKSVLGENGTTKKSSAPVWGEPDTGASDGGLWKPPGSDDTTDMMNGGGTGGFTSSEGLWKPPGSNEEATDTFQFSADSTGDSWQPSTSTMETTKRKADQMDDNGCGDENGDFHKDVGAATADKFYSGLTRTLDTRSESRLYHMRAFNGWVKATQIQELNPITIQQGKRKKGSAPLRILDLACGKGGDLGKWILHPRKMSNYVGVDVARGSLKDAAIRVRNLRNKMERCTFTCADLGADVPGRLKSPKKKQMQKLLTWSLQNESEFEPGPPEFKCVRGGGISQSDRFDVVSIQFAIHYMMSTRKRARRFFRTVSELLEIGGNLIATTIDARVVIDHLMNLGEDLHFDSEKEKDEDPNREVVVSVGAGACRIRFQRHIVKKIFKAAAKENGSFSENVFGLEYTFTLVEGSDHAAGVGEAVDLPEWLTPLPVLKSLAEEAGLELEYAQNFHEFFTTRKDPQDHPAAHLALYNMKVLNRNGSISKDEWEISRLYCAVKFKKVREAQSILDDDSDAESDEEDATNEAASREKQETKNEATVKPDQKLLVKAMMKAKMSVGKGQWETLSGDEKKRLTQLELAKLSS